MTRNNSFSSSVSSRTPSVSSRNTSNNSFSSSVGPGHARSASAHTGGRYQTSFSQSTTTRPTSALPKSRPASSLELNSSDEDVPSQGKRQGMQSQPQIQSSVTSLHMPAVQGGRAPQSMHSHRYQRSLSNTRDFSVSTAMSQLRIDDAEYNRPEEHQAISARMKRPSSASLSHNPFLNNGIQNGGIDGSESALVLFQPPEGSLVAPQTPSQIPVPSKRYPSNGTPCKTSKKYPHRNTNFTEDSNAASFLAWDVRGRLEDMEAMYFEMKDKMAGTNLERSGLEEAVALYKARGESWFPCPYRMTN